MNVRIRRAGPDDAVTVHRFVCELAEYEREPAAVELTPEILRSQLSSENPPFECVLAESDDGIALGFALYFFNYSTWRGRRGLYLEDLFVSIAHRRHGVGRALLRHLACTARDRDCARMEWSVLDWNQPAIDFYKKLGAVPMSEWTVFRLTGAALASLAGP